MVFSCESRTNITIRLFVLHLMSRLHNLPYALKQSFDNHSVLKVITGLNNFDKSLVSKVARSASIGGADLLDIACDAELVRAATEISDVPVAVT